MSEMRNRAVLGVLDGAAVTAVARRFGLPRQTVRSWLRRYACDGAVVNLEDRSSRPHGCPHQMAAEVEARVLMLREARLALTLTSLVSPPAGAPRPPIKSAMLIDGRSPPTKPAKQGVAQRAEHTGAARHP